MGLSGGDHVGPYEVIAPLGEGGMGSVWRARDPRLGRDVAIKVLSDAFAADADRLARFTRESLFLAALNHPHIATILGIEDIPAGHAIVMEHLAGPTLAERLAGGPLPIADALALARDIASGLEAAHDGGIVHRDLKPGNLKFTADDRIKILDFGLAKSVAAAVSVLGHPGPSPTSPGGPEVRAHVTRSPTSLVTTETGILLGTAAYMSPEQARGDMVDRRADVWSFGCVLYEMLTGRRVFHGTSVVDVLAAVMTLDPDWSVLPSGTPPSVRRLLHACLRRDSRQRLRDMGDVRLLLEDALSGREPEPAALAAPSRPAWPRTAVAGAAVAVLAAGIAIGFYGRSGTDPPPHRKLEVAIQDPTLDIFSRPRISPDGRAIVYSATDRLWVRRLDRLEPQALPGSHRAEAAFWSPDGRTVAFAAARRLWRLAIDGAEPMAICDLPPPGRIVSGTWRDDDVIVFGAWQGSLYEVPAKGGDPKEILAIDPKIEVDFHELTALPDRAGLIFVRHERVGELQHVELFADGRRSILLRAHGAVRFDNPRLDPRGYLLYERLEANAGIWAVPFSIATRRVTGEPFRVAPGATMPSISRDGTLVYAEQSVSYELAWIDRDGARVERIGSAQPEMQFPALSPDGRTIAVAAADEARVQDRDVWLIDVATGRRTRLQPMPTPTRDLFATWAPDGRSLVYLQARRDPMTTVSARLDGSGVADLVPASGRAVFSPDGRHLVYPRSDAAGRSDLWWIAVGPSGVTQPSPFARDGARNVLPAFSPDGSMVAYTSEQGGQDDVYLRRFPPTDERWRVTADGGLNPVWTADGAEIIYAAPDGSLVAMPVSTRPAVTFGTPRKVTDEASTGAVAARGFDVSPDGRRLLVVRRSDAGHNMHLVVVERWLSEFER